MTFNEMMTDLPGQVIAASKEFALKAEAKAQDMGERGILMVDIKRLEGKIERLLLRLGNEVDRLLGGEVDSVDRNTPEIGSILTEIEDIRKTIERKKTELDSRRKV